MFNVTAACGNSLKQRSARSRMTFVRQLSSWMVENSMKMPGRGQEGVEASPEYFRSEHPERR